MSLIDRLSSSTRILACTALALAAPFGAGCAASGDLVVIDDPRGVGTGNGRSLQAAADPRGEEIWRSFSGVAIGCPAVVTTPQGDIEVFTHGEDNALWARHYDPLSGAWRDWQSLGGVLASAPAVAAGPDGRIDVFVRGTDNALWVRTLDGAWGKWQSLGGRLTSAPAAVSAAPGSVDVVARGTDGAVWHRALRKGQWSEWESLGGQITSAPAITSWGGARLDVFARGTDNALWHRSRDAVSSEGRAKGEEPVAAWGEWQSRGGVLWSDPAAISVRPGRIDVAVRGSNNALWVRRYDGAWGEWQSGGGKLFSGVAITRVGREKLLFLGAAADGVLETLHGPGAPTGGEHIEGARLLPPPT